MARGFVNRERDPKILAERRRVEKEREKLQREFDKKRKRVAKNFRLKYCPNCGKKVKRWGESSGWASTFLGCCSVEFNVCPFCESEFKLNIPSE